ncbi:MAG TPA: enoyl-CoA hydratase/isomerase family protein [Pirellulaceae bacterium]|nr:enoyl-CoA hydratase/isomerase family protein [Pirellulaceae bacterium]HMO90861.1 enoyl-CoA hydratase/isomerase family protein [Pirellulaceae bacterium]HMP68663.1 enoyl-CoA hydratase/isomerase family protein [Pirellulaceae bacterium]
MLELHTEDQIATVKMSHGKVNAMDIEFCQTTIDMLRKLEADSDCRAVILTGRGTVFSAGVDLIRVVKEDCDYLDEFLPKLSEMFKAFFAFPKPMVGLVNGAAIAGGCVLVCACDYRVALESARIGIPELRVGVPLPTAGLEIMRFAANTSSFRQIVSNGKTFSGAEAIHAGLIDELQPHDELPNAAFKMSRELIQIPPEVFSHTKRHVRSIASHRIRSGEAEYETYIRSLWRRADVRKNIQDYVERNLKRAPN